MRSYVVWQDGFVVKPYITDERITVILQLTATQFYTWNTLSKQLSVSFEG